MLTDSQFEDTKNVIDALDNAGKLVSDRDRERQQKEMRKMIQAKITSLVFPTKSKLIWSRLMLLTFLDCNPQGRDNLLNSKTFKSITV